MRIALICPEFPPHITGGGGKVFEALAVGYDTRGHRVDVLSADYTRSAPRLEHREHGDVYRFRLFPTPKFAPFLRTVLPPVPREAYVLSRILTEGRYDVAHLHGFSLPYIDIASALCRRAGIPQVLTIHGFPASQNRSSLPLRLAYGAYIHCFTSPTLGRARFVTLLSASLRRPILDSCAARLRVIGNGIGSMAAPKDEVTDTDVFAVNLLCVGRLAFDKGFQDVIQALPLLRSQCSSLRLTIAGPDHGEQRNLERMAAELAPGLVRLPGRWDSTRVATEMHKATAVVVPSHNEPFGLVALEAMSVGAAVLAADSGALAEIVRDGVDGISFEARNPRAIAAGIRRLISDGELRKRIRRSAPNRAREFQWHPIVDRYLTLLEDAADSYRTEALLRRGRRKP